MTKKALLKLKARFIKETSYFISIKKGYVEEPFVSNHLPINEHQFNTSYYCVYTPKNNKNVHFVTVLSYYKNEFVLKCSDPYLEGKLKPDTLKKLSNNALVKANLSSTGYLAKSFTKGFGIAPKSTSCSFNQENFETVGPLCQHLVQFLKDMPKDVPDTLFKNYTLAQTQDSLQNCAPNSLSAVFKRYAFKKHILLEGDKGSGKTYFATKYTKIKNVTQIFIGGHEQFESIDFLGHFIQKKDASLIWKDGALSQAFRLAQEGKRVILIIDEMLRIPKRELNLLVSALAPINNHYILRTGRAEEEKNEIASEEVLLAPTENLWVIGTTNVGEDYATEEIDEALIDRFKPLRKEVSETEIQSILIKRALQKSFTMDTVQCLLSFYNKMEYMHKTKLLYKIVNLRHLKEAIDFATNESEVQQVIKDSILLWVQRDRDGKPNENQLATVNSVISVVWKES